MTDTLIERLEKLTGPDREVDLELWWACKAQHSGQPMDADYKARNIKMDDAPRYTASLDAALTLVPEGYDNLQIVRQRIAGRGFVATLAPSDHVNPFPVKASIHGVGKTKIIALCIAALKSRALQVKG